jgi:hypothetical protein
LFFWLFFSFFWSRLELRLGAMAAQTTAAGMADGRKSVSLPVVAEADGRKSVSPALKTAGETEEKSALRAVTDGAMDAVTTAVHCLIVAGILATITAAKVVTTVSTSTVTIMGIGAVIATTVHFFTFPKRAIMSTET